MVTFETVPSDEMANEFAEKYNLEKVEILWRSVICRLTNKSGTNPIKFVRYINENKPKGVAYVEHNFYHIAISI